MDPYNWVTPLFSAMPLTPSSVRRMALGSWLLMKRIGEAPELGLIPAAPIEPHLFGFFDIPGRHLVSPFVPSGNKPRAVSL